MRAPRGYYAQGQPPVRCLACELDVPADHFVKRSQPRGRLGFTWACKERVRRYHQAHYQRVMNEPERAAHRKETDRLRYLKDPLYIRYKQYRNIDRRRGHIGTLSWEQALPLMQGVCHYCAGPSGGLNRLNSSLGHSLANSVSCCHDCNNILGDLPVTAKAILGPALAECRTLGALDGWTPPVMRNRKGARVQLSAH